MKKLLTKIYGVLLIGLTVSTISCKKDVIEQPISDEDATVARAIYSSRSVNWDNRSTGTYTRSMAEGDFGNVNTWNDSRAYISSGTCRVTLLANALSGAGGLIANIDVSDGSEYQLQYNIKFHSAFDWSRGGKIGFGFLIGDGNTGCDRADDGNGGSARMMWYNDYSRVYFRPYVYYKDMPEQCGDNFGKSYPSSGSISKSTWYTIKIYVKSNTGSSYNGQVKFFVNGTTVLSKTTGFRWTTNDAKRLVKSISFHTFRGGSDSYWQSGSQGYIYYDNFSFSRLAN